MNTYLVCDQNHTGDQRSIEAGTPERAACAFTEWWNDRHAEWPESRTVIVQHPDGQHFSYVVSCEPVPTYSAKRKKGI